MPDKAHKPRMFIPLATDAPIYYRPVGTIGIISLNVIVYFATLRFPSLLETYGLVHGTGIHPLQWLTSSFLHGSFLHLLGNMIFLWGFGLVVEGKLGWQRFVPLYIGIGVVECVLEVCLLEQPGLVSYGASAIIFGLMAIALLWAPHNEVTVGYVFFFLIFIRVGTFDLAIVWFAALTFLKSIFLIWLMGDATSELLHLLGAVVGGIAGLVMLKMKWVDCEGWDLITVIQGKTPVTDSNMSYGYQSDAARRSTRTTAQRKKRPQKLSGLIEIDPLIRVAELIEQQKPHAALAEIRKQQHLKPDWKPQPIDMLRLARLFRSWKEWHDAVLFFREYLSESPTDSLARLEVAEILVLVQDRPHAALKVLKPCETTNFTPKQLKQFHAIKQRALQLIQTGVIEMETEEW